MTKVSELEKTVNENVTRLALTESTMRVIREKVEEGFSNIENRLNMQRASLDVIMNAISSQKRTPLQKVGDIARNIKDIAITSAIVVVALLALTRSGIFEKLL